MTEFVQFFFENGRLDEEVQMHGAHCDPLLLLLLEATKLL